MKNRRKHTRLSFKTEIWLGREGVFGRTDEVISSLSIGGASIQSSQAFAPGTLLSLRFKLSRDADFISCTAVTRYIIGGCRVGLEFLDLSPEDRQRIKSFIDHQLLSEALARTRMALAPSGPQPSPARQRPLV